MDISRREQTTHSVLDPRFKHWELVCSLCTAHALWRYFLPRIMGRQEYWKHTEWEPPIRSNHRHYYCPRISASPGVPSDYRGRQRLYLLRLLVLNDVVMEKIIREGLTGVHYSARGFDGIVITAAVNCCWYSAHVFLHNITQITSENFNQIVQTPLLRSRILLVLGGSMRFVHLFIQLRRAQWLISLFPV